MTRVRPDGRLPDVQPAAGHYLLAGIDTVLASLSTPAPAGLPLADELRGALARTAACGDTCRVRQPADAVRQAAGLLRGGSIDEAHELLRQVRAELVARPRLKLPE